MRIRYATDLSAEEYVGQRAWKLDEVETVIEKVRESPSQEVAAKNIRIDIEISDVLRWIRLRIKLVRATLAMLIELIKPYLTVNHEQ